MGRNAVLVLQNDDRKSLEKMVDRGADWRARQRAQTLILLDDGFTMNEVAAAINIHVRTVGSTRTSWILAGMDSLADLERSGAPRKISPEDLERLVALAGAQPLSARDLLAKHIEGGGLPVHLNTLTIALKEAGLLWKRTRHSLKNKRNEVAFREAQAEIEDLRNQAAAGEIVLAYVDEVGFSQVHPNRSAWTPKGERHLVEAKRGKRLNVLAAMLSTGRLYSAKLWQSTTAEAFTGFLGLLKEYVGKPLVVILDNASIHKAKASQPIVKYLEQQGLKLYFLPPYSPELNRIERLWHKMKYTWMAVKCRNSVELEADVDHIISNFGTTYQFAF